MSQRVVVQTPATQSTTNSTPETSRLGLNCADVVAMLAEFGDRAPESVDDVVGSLELTWLITRVEQRHSVTLDLTDAQLARIRTVADAADVLGEALGGSAATAAGADADAGATRLEQH